MKQTKVNGNGYPVRYSVYSGRSAYYAVDHMNGSEACMGDGTDVWEDMAGATALQTCDILGEALNGDQGAADSLSWIRRDDEQVTVVLEATVGIPETLTRLDAHMTAEQHRALALADALDRLGALDGFVRIMAVELAKIRTEETQRGGEWRLYGYRVFVDTDMELAHRLLWLSATHRGTYPDCSESKVLDFLMEGREDIAG